MRNNTIPRSEWNVFCKGAPIVKEKPAPLPSGFNVSLKVWANFVAVASVVPNFLNALQSMKEHPKEWDTWIISSEPFLAPFPKFFKSEITLFQRLLMVRILRQEKTLYAMSYYIEETLGKKFASNSAAVMEEVQKTN